MTHKQIIQIAPLPTGEITTAYAPLDHNPAAVYLASLSSQRSRRVMEHALRVIMSLLTGQDPATANVLAMNWGALRYPHSAAVRARLLEMYSPATANRTLSALRGVLKEAWRLGQTSAEDFARATDVKNIQAHTLPAGRELSKEEIAALVANCQADRSPAGMRDAAIMGILYTCGLRREEVVNLNVSDYDDETGRMNIRSGKGRKGRTVYVTGGAARALDSWLYLRGSFEGPLILAVLKNGRIMSHRLTAQTIYNMVKKRANLAGIADFSPHDFRRTFVGDMLDQGIDIATVANIAGHASVDTTRRYDRRPEETKKAASRVLKFPF